MNAAREPGPSCLRGDSALDDRCTRDDDAGPLHPGPYSPGAAEHRCDPLTSEKPMPLYVDGYLLPVPRKKLAAYRSMARRAGKIWREHGAVEFRECVEDDLDAKMGAPFRRGLRLKQGEVVMFSFIVYRSRAQRDRVNAKVMKDPRMAKMMKMEVPPFDSGRMGFGGFRVLVNA
jgi:uncharacterized protein YbaA (DUF1428 family)